MIYDNSPPQKIVSHGICRPSLQMNQERCIQCIPQTGQLTVVQALQSVSIPEFCPVMGTATDNISFGGADFLSLMLVLFVSILHTFSLVADLVFKSETLSALVLLSSTFVNMQIDSYEYDVIRGDHCFNEHSKIQYNISR